MEVHELHPARKISRWIKSNIAANLNKMCRRTAPVWFVTEQIGCWIVGLMSFGHGVVLRRRRGGEWLCKGYLSCDVEIPSRAFLKARYC
jgi:hypothetical protein